MLPAAATTGAPGDDTELMRRVQTGDEAALGTLMQRWELPVKSVIGRLVFNTSEAEELAQETFVRLWQQREKFRREAAFRPWLFSIAINLARNRLRWWRRRPGVALEDWNEVEKPAAGESHLEGELAAARLERQERGAAVREAVAALPADLREALVLFEYEGWSHAEIATALGCSTKAVETRIHRAREKLRKPLAKWLAG